MKLLTEEKCLCKGTGLIPPVQDLKKSVQVYCPTHKCKRYWPQLQSNGGVEFKELKEGNGGLK